jgi:molybdenum cofactor cytidylyltransferase
MIAAAVILAAGAGSRMGTTCKAALALPDGTSFLHAILHAARAGGCARVVVVCGPPHAERVRELCGEDEIRVHNPDPERGMISSLALGLAACRDADVDIDVALSWPVDQPRVLARTVEHVLSRATRGRVVIPTHRGRGGHPTAFGAEVWPELAVASSARAVVRADPSRVLRLATDDPAILVDVDTPADHARLR